MKGGKESEIDNKNEPVENMPLYAISCAWALALPHTKSGDPAMIAGKVGNSALTAAAKSKRIITAGRAS
jgi:hypothetical protein